LKNFNILEGTYSRNSSVLGC